MGVSGAGKSTLGELLARRLGWRLVEADAYHPPGNVEKMRAGLPLDDEDRRPWLTAVREELDRATEAGASVVLACSALKRAYRKALTDGLQADVLFVHLAGDRALLEQRMRQRQHFMPAALLDSQLSTLEPPAEDDPALTLDVSEPPEALVERVLEELERRDRA